MVKRELNGLHITVLVSNVGGGIKNPLMSEFTGNSSFVLPKHRSRQQGVTLRDAPDARPAAHVSEELYGGGALIISVGSMAR
ncbi:hypothetical protein PG996_012134 [Apiospora saccharicola]|uniref:Uncharacterized protein n=1 Tax=Apiospora saccharicola TaxID=335842 RepID=A0ABR1U4E7_9PEZI